MLTNRRHISWLNDALTNKIVTQLTAKLVNLGINQYKILSLIKIKIKRASKLASVVQFIIK